MTTLTKSTHSKPSFLQELKLTYSFYKKCYEQDKLIFGEFAQFKQKKTNDERTSSKSKKKKAVSPLKLTRRSTRFKINQQQKLKQLRKEPLWQPNKRKANRQSRKTTNAIVDEMKIGTKVKASNPLYEFYSQYEDIDQEIGIKEKRKQNKKNDQIVEQKSKEQKDQKSQQQKDQKNNQQIFHIQQQQNEEMIENWVPSKQQKSLLAIQRIIDQYLLFKLSMRNNQVALLSELINYVRQIKGYYFNQNVLTQMLAINNKLYKILVIDHEKYVKCTKLSYRLIERRQLSTKIRMKRSNQQ